MKPELHCFGDNVRPELFDRQPFVFRHQLLGHPALEMANLARMIPALPDWQVHYSSGKLERTDNFETAAKEHGNGMSLEETIDTLKTSNSYIMIREPHRDGTFHPLYQELVKDVQGILRARGMRDTLHGPKFYLFISSPNSITPFHIDRSTNFLMQFQGSKEITVFPQWDPRVMSAESRESHVAYGDDRPQWRPEIEPLGTTFDFQPGDALHIPFIAGHHVKNGPSEVSISLSFFFRTDENLVQTDAMVFNHVLRRRGIPVGSIGTNATSDQFKAGVWRTVRHARRHARTIGAVAAAGAAAGAYSLLAD